MKPYAQTLLATRSLDALNALLKGEISAVETYQQALSTFGNEAPEELRSCLLSHQARVQQLTVRVYDLGGKPAEGSGVWGAFARMVEGGAALFGRKSALSALEEGEDHGLIQYRALLEDLDADSRFLVEDELLPEQLKSHDVVRNLHHVCA